MENKKEHHFSQKYFYDNFSTFVFPNGQKSIIFKHFYLPGGTWF